MPVRTARYSPFFFYAQRAAHMRALLYLKSAGRFGLRFALGFARAHRTRGFKSALRAGAFVHAGARCLNNGCAVYSSRRAARTVRFGLLPLLRTFFAFAFVAGDMTLLTHTRWCTVSRASRTPFLRSAHLAACLYVPRRHYVL